MFLSDRDKDLIDRARLEDIRESVSAKGIQTYPPTTIRPTLDPAFREDFPNDFFKKPHERRTLLDVFLSVLRISNYLYRVRPPKVSRLELVTIAGLPIDKITLKPTSYSQKVISATITILRKLGILYAYTDNPRILRFQPQVFLQHLALASPIYDIFLKDLEERDNYANDGTKTPSEVSPRGTNAKRNAYFELLETIIGGPELKRFRENILVADFERPSLRDYFRVYEPTGTPRIRPEDETTSEATSRTLEEVEE